MTPDLLDLYERASAWTLTKVAGAATKLDAPTRCDEWDVRQLMNHMLDTANYFVGSARGDEVSPPAPDPPEFSATTRLPTSHALAPRPWRRSARMESSTALVRPSVSRSATSSCTAGTWRRRRGRT